MKIDLSGQTVLVTGASRGIGAACAKALAAAGARVAVHGNRNRAAAEALAEEIGGGARAFLADLTLPETCRLLWREVEAALGPIDCLVNNAGLADLADIDEAPDSEWDAVWERTLAVNLTAAAVLSREAIHSMGKRGGGRLIHISSRAAFRGDTPDYLAYAASKGGLVALHRSIARGCGKEGIRSFLIAPGFVRTDMAQDFIDSYGEDYAKQGIATDRLTEPGDLAPMIVLLASGLADHATGASIDINAASYVH